MYNDDGPHKSVDLVWRDIRRAVTTQRSDASECDSLPIIGHGSPGPGSHGDEGGEGQSLGRWSPPYLLLITLRYTLNILILTSLLHPG